ncbi:MAG: NAD(P)/FAD-dependent oxidoreductase [Acidimicrobiales bacterium]
MPATAAGRYDVVVVGARCAGSPLATHLAGAGLSVVLVDRVASVATETASTHVFQAEGVACLGRLGVLDRLEGTGAPWISQARMRLGDISVTVPWPTRAGDPGPQLCVRRSLLDPILLERAAGAGVDVRLGTRVTGLVKSDGRVTGVEGESEGRALTLEAPVVVGADGRSSTMARLVAARRYNVVPNERFAYWGYYEGARWEPPATLLTQRWDDEFVISCPADSGLYLVIVYPPLARLDRFRKDADASFDAAVSACAPVAEIVAEGRRVGRLSTMASYEGFFRDSAGPGWVLVGDAGHFKDPAPGQGISDALRQAERLSAVIVETAGSPDADRDRALRQWWRERDRDEAEMHWFAADMGGAGRVPLVLSEIVKARIAAPGGAAQMFDVFNHRVPPSKVLTAPRLATATARLLAAGRHPRKVVLSEVGDILRQEIRRQLRNRRPTYAV